MSHKLEQIERYMKINRKDLKWFMKNIRYHSDGKELTDEELVEQLATYMETNLLLNRWLWCFFTYG